MSKQHHRFQAHRQRGLSLVTTLLFMVAALMLGVSVLSVNVMQERTIGNTKDRDLALQAAEAALRDAEKFVATSNINATAFPGLADPCNNGLCIPPSQRNPASSLSVEQVVGFDWATQSRVAADFPGVSAPARYVVERVGELECPPGETCVKGRGRPPGFGYRITARALGAREETVVILQSMFTVR